MTVAHHDAGMEDRKDERAAHYADAAKWREFSLKLADAAQRINERPAAKPDHGAAA